MGFSVQEPEGKYTKSDRRIMDFVEDYTDEFLFMSIGQLAERLGMSEATVSRCARHLGYRDFKEMKNDLIQKKAGKGAAGKLAGTLMKDQGFDVENWFDFQRECLERTRENLDMGQFQEAVQCIGSARNIYIHAKNASLAAARLLFFRLRRLGFQASLIPSGGSEVLEGIAHAGEGDLAILFSFSKVSEEGRMILDYAREAGCSTLAFTSRLYAPQEQRADVNLYVYRGEKEEFHTMSSAVAVIDALVLALSDSMQPKAAEKLMRLQKLKKKYGRRLYGKEDGKSGQE
ncbi:MurR/RpiR family transcriptional regulator [Lachnoclostridium phocaeense]|uniref:MurR/RpiR family transcriptional regulator n=1 Tax=Lachnoclostridium phocaeense TaxID=1871021 RepID=UPI00248F279E|nr:MurR/RpiR family transcriptional regulator [Lachnoclostridium phocaeense]